MSRSIFPDELTLLHNPRCSKSRSAKALLDERGITYRERRYLDQPLTETELLELQRLLALAPGEWIRRGENEFTAAGLDRSSDAASMISAMAHHPMLIERPILIGRQRAVIGRPPERILELL